MTQNYPPQPGQYQPQPGQYPPQQPPMYAPQGAYAQAPMPPPKKKSGALKIILIILGVLLVVGVVGVIALVKFATTTDSDSKTYVDYLIQGKTDSAYAMWTPELQAVQDKDTFAAQVDSLDLSPSCALAQTGININSDLTGKTKDFEGTLTCPGDTYTISLSWIARNNGPYQLIEWRAN